MCALGLHPRYGSSCLLRISVVRWLVVSKPILLTRGRTLLSRFAPRRVSQDVLSPSRALDSHPPLGGVLGRRRGVEAGLLPSTDLVVINDAVSRNGIKFVLASTNGVTSSIFSDFGSRSPYHVRASRRRHSRDTRGVELGGPKRLWGRGTARQS